MELIFEISLMDNDKYFKTYKYPFIPNVGDKLAIDCKTVFLVEGRLLSIEKDSRNVVLFGHCI